MPLIISWLLGFFFDYVCGQDDAHVPSYLEPHKFTTPTFAVAKEKSFGKSWSLTIPISP